MTFLILHTGFASAAFQLLPVCSLALVLYLQPKLLQPFCFQGEATNSLARSPSGKINIL